MTERKMKQKAMTPNLGKSIYSSLIVTKIVKQDEGKPIFHRIGVIKVPGNRKTIGKSLSSEWDIALHIMTLLHQKGILKPGSYNHVLLTPPLKRSAPSGKGKYNGVLNVDKAMIEDFYDEMGNSGLL